MMKRIRFSNCLAGALALALGAQACTITTGDGQDDETSDDEASDDDADAGGDDETTDDETDDESTDDETTDDESTDDETTDDETTDDTDAGGDDEASDDDSADAGGPVDEGESDAGDDPVPEGDAGADPDPGETPSDEYAAAFPAFDCGDRDPGDLEPSPANIDTDTTWSGTVYVEGEVRVRDVEFTIEPGTRVIMGSDSRLIIGFNGDAARVNINGSEAAPVTFCGQEPDAGFWQGIIVDGNVVSASSISNVLVDGAGADQASLDLRTNVTVTNVLVQNGEGDGVRAADFDEDSTGLFVRDNAGFSAVVTTGGAVHAFPVGGNLTGNGRDGVLIDQANFDTDVTLRNLLVPYVVEVPELRLRDGGTFVFQAGVEFAMGADSRIIAGFNGSDTTVQLAGTAEAPVVFRGVAADLGFWRGITLESNVRSDSFLEHVEIHDAGGEDSFALSLFSPVRVSELTLSNSENGVYISEAGLDAGSAAWTISGISAEPIVAEANAWPSLPLGSALSGNGQDRVRIEGSNFDESGTIPNLGVPYLVTSEVRLRDGIETSIEPGTHFVMTADSRFIVGFNGSDATLLAVGTEAAPIRFTGLDEVSGYWSGIEVQSNVSSSTSFDFVEIGHAGQGPAALELNRAVPVTNCTIFQSGSAGIAKREDDGSDYTESNTFTDNVGADVVDL